MRQPACRFTTWTNGGFLELPFALVSDKKPFCLFPPEAYDWRGMKQLSEGRKGICLYLLSVGALKVGKTVNGREGDRIQKRLKRRKGNASHNGIND
jgi:hypothetical protein